MEQNTSTHIIDLSLPNNSDRDKRQAFNITKVKFPGGEPHVVLNINSMYMSMGDNSKITIFSRIRNSDDVMYILLTKQALDNTKLFDKIELAIPYFPGARMDRIMGSTVREMTTHEPIAVKIYAELINNANFDKVKIADPHSDVTTALLDNVEIIDQTEFLKETVKYQLEHVSNVKVINIVSPDAGSNKKIKDVMQFLTNLPRFKDIEFQLIKCDKTRDLKTGKLTDFVVYAEDLGNHPTVIIDDICDGGGTFLGLGKELLKKNAGKMTLAVTHGIFSKGLETIYQVFDNIVTTNSYYTLAEYVKLFGDDMVMEGCGFKLVPLNYYK